MISFYSHHLLIAIGQLTCFWCLPCIVNIGQVLLRKCDYDGAKEQFCIALEIYNAKLPDNHPKIATAAQLMERVEQEEALCV